MMIGMIDPEARLETSTNRYDGVAERFDPLCEHAMPLKVALERLGFVKCYHMTEIFAQPDHVGLWDAAGRGRPVDWEALFRGYQATVDWPGCNFYAESLRLYPDAKVI